MPFVFHPARIRTVSPFSPCSVSIPFRVACFTRFILLAGFLAGTFQTFAFAGESDSLRWHFEGQRRVRDGGVEGFFYLHGADGLEIEELEFFYVADFSARRMNPDAQHAQPENNKAAYYKKVPADTRNLIIYSGRYMRIELWAVAKTGGATYITQTALNLYGQSGVDKTDFEKLDEPPLLPAFNMNRGRSAYSAMTGEPVNFSMRNGLSGTVRIYLDGEKITELPPEEGVYNYVLPSGRKLSTRALMDHHELLFVTDPFESGDAGGIVRFTCCLPLYRSMRDNLDFSGGIAALFSAMALSLIAVVLTGRRFVWR
jgi:hypothetical protein